MLVVYVAMVLTFNSLVTPFIILFSLPLATIGAFTALYVTGRPLGVSALIGLLMLIGIVVTNAIVLLDLVERHRREGMPVREALIRGGHTRIRPILMTQAAQSADTRARGGAAGLYLGDAALARRGFSAKSFDDVHAYFNEIARHVAAANGAGLIDLSAAATWDSRLLYDGLHFSETGSRQAAEIIARALAVQIRELRTRAGTP